MRQGRLALALSAASITAITSAALAQDAQPAIDPEQNAVLEARGETSFAPDLISQAEAAPEALGDAQADRLDALNADPTTLSVRIIDLDVSALNGAAVRFAPSAEFDAIARRVESDPLDEGGFVWVGELDEVPGSAVLVVREGRVTGNVRSGDRLYEISPLGDLHALREVDVNAFPEEHPPEFEQIEDESQARDLPPADLLADPDQVRQIDLLVAYTPAAAAAVPDIEAHIALAVAENNLANRNSDVNILVKAVESYQLDYVESGSHFTDLARIEGTGDGFMDEIHDVRDQHGADAVLMMIDEGSFCGLASAILADEAEAFATVHYSCATGYYSFAHELGHLQGARHNPEVDGSTSPFAYGHGMVRPAQSDRTVMAYNCAGGCTRKPYWSGPNVMEGGLAFGDAAERDNARVLNRTASTISNFRSPPRQGATAYAWAHNPSSNGYNPSAAYTHNSSGGEVAISRLNTGYYRVTFEGIGGDGVAGGHVQVSAYGSSNHYCKSSGWASSGPDFTAYVRCFTPAGAAADTYYNIYVRWP